MRKLLVFITAVALTSCASSKKVVQITPPNNKSSSKVVNVVPDFKAKPIYVPPEVVRVLIMPYEDDKGVLHQGEFVYFTLKPGYWTIATKGEVQKVKKMVRIVQTQKELDSSIVSSEVVESFGKQKKETSKKANVPSRLFCGSNCSGKKK